MEGRRRGRILGTDIHSTVVHSSTVVQLSTFVHYHIHYYVPAAEMDWGVCCRWYRTVVRGVEVLFPGLLYSAYSTKYIQPPFPRTLNYLLYFRTVPTLQYIPSCKISPTTAISTTTMGSQL